MKPEILPLPLKIDLYPVLFPKQKYVEIPPAELEPDINKVESFLKQKF